jgi:hypothetical protein
MLEFRIEVDIGYVDHRALEDRPPRSEGPSGARRQYAVQLLESLRRVVVVSGKMEKLAVEPI